MSKRLGGIKGCKYKTSSWHLQVIALVFVRGLFLDIVFCFFMGALVLALTLVLLFGLQFFLALR